MRVTMLGLVGAILMAAGFLAGALKYYVLAVGAAFLILAFVSELLTAFPRGKRFPPRNDWVELGNISVISGKLIVSDGGETQIAITFSRGCELEARVLVATTPDGKINRILELQNATPHTTSNFDRELLLVDTCVMIAVDSSLQSIPFRSLMEQSGIYSLIDDPATPAATLIKHRGINRGVILQTGLGDGEYPVELRSSSENKFAIICNFDPIPEAGDGSGACD